MNLVTGGLGFIGSWLAKILLEAGEKVTTFSRSSPGKKEGLFKNYKDNWHHVRGTLDRFSDVLSLIEKTKPEIIFHIGGMLSIPSENNPQASFTTNVEGMFYVLEAARLFGVKKVIYASTNGTYDLGLEDVKIIDDNTIQRPATIYGCTKVFGELLGRFYFRKYGIDFRSIRLPAVVGPGSKIKHVSVYSAWAIEKSILGEPYEIFVTPETICPIIYYKDAAQAFYDLSVAPEENIKTINYNLVGIKPIPSAGELKELIEKKVKNAQLSFNPEPLAMEYQKKHQTVIWKDEAAMQEWGWKPKFSLDRMIDDFIIELTDNYEWYQ